jgi:hypothetical protein
VDAGGLHDGGNGSADAGNLESKFGVVPFDFLRPPDSEGWKAQRRLAWRMRFDRLLTREISAIPCYGRSGMTAMSGELQQFRRLQAQ